ncbi:MAG TPA: two-component system sensor histidine kinase CreC [Burkholderiaceae bacterium]|nr:two-component system sensor histidine kinase CreC [Burkholderiaceae bacterium]HQR69807.1 two-component system sensor histidine kinase CreC [Burkholderiaceae bacterium]
MSRRSRIFLGAVVVYVAAVVFLLYQVSADLDPRYRESAEDSLVDTANLLATLLERQAYSGVIQTEELERTLQQLGQRPLNARIFSVDKTRVDLHVYVTDANGIVLYDSAGRDVGKDYRAWRDVGRSLAGQYGARTTLVDAADPASAVMYVGAAIRERVSADAPDEIVGMVGVGKPIAAFSPFITNAREKLVIFGVISVAAFALLLLMVTVWLVRPFGLVTDVWRALRAGPGDGRSVGNSLRTAFLDMRDALAGKSYVDEYVAALTHEIKSPLAAIRGAAELLREPLPEDARVRFAGNVEEQVKRAQDLVERMLELSGLERRRALQQREAVSLAQLADTVREEMAPLATRRDVELFVDVDPDFVVSGDRFLLQRALANLVLNAIEFSPREGTVTVDAHAGRGRVELTVRDHGPGLPEFARDRVFEKFFSLPRPDTGRKGTGLGLAFVREVAVLHGGVARLSNHPEGGAVATLILPRALPR